MIQILKRHGATALMVLLTATLLSTLTSAWRWRTVSSAFGLPLTMRGSVAAYYRSQFLNATLPGGILGDAHRAVVQGREVGDVGAGVRATVWERSLGQVVQLGLLLVALSTLAPPLRDLVPVAAGGALVVLGIGWFLLHRGGRPSAERPGGASHYS